MARWRPTNYSAALDALVDESGNGLHARLGSSVGADSNDPLRLQYSGEKCLYVPGGGLNYVSTPDAAANSPTVDFGYIFDIDPTTWDVATNNTVGGKWNTPNPNQRSFLVRLQASKQLAVNWSTDGTAANIFGVTWDCTGFTGRKKFRIRRVKATGQVTLDEFTGGAWVSRNSLAVSATVVRAGEGIFDSDSRYDVGAINAGEIFDGKIYLVELEVVIGAVSQRFLPTEANEPYASFVSSTGETYTFNRSTTGRKLAVVDRDMFLLGTDDYFTVADNPLLNFSATQSFSVACVVRQYANPANFARFFSKEISTPQGWALLNNGTSAKHYMTTNDGTNSAGTAGSDTLDTLGVAQLYGGVVNRFTQKVSAVRGRTFFGGVGSAAVGSLVNNAPLLIGKDYTTIRGDYEWLGGAVFREALSADDFGRLAIEMGGGL